MRIDRIRAGVIQQIMCQYQVNLHGFTSHYIKCDSNISLFDYFNSELQRLTQFEDDGLIKWTENGFQITEHGRYFMRPIAAVFDRYMNPQDKDKSARVVRFSRTI